MGVSFLLFCASSVSSAPLDLVTNGNNGDQYVQYHVNKPVLSFQPSSDGRDQQREPRILFDGDVYYSDAKP